MTGNEQFVYFRKNLTQEEFDAIPIKDNNTIYFVGGDANFTFYKLYLGDKQIGAGGGTPEWVPIDEVED